MRQIFAGNYQDQQGFIYNWDFIPGLVSNRLVYEQNMGINSPPPSAAPIP